MYYLIVLESIDDIVKVLRMFPNLQNTSVIYPALDPDEVLTACNIFKDTEPRDGIP